jgi:hypothetical protein
LAVLLAAGRVDASVQSSARAGAMAPGEAGTGLLELTPRLTALVLEPTTELQAVYAPRLYLRGSAAMRHDALVSAGWQQTRNLRWFAHERFGYGRNEFGWDPGASRPFDALDAVPPVLHDFLTSDAAVAFSYLASRTTSWSGSLGYGAYGGLSAASQQQLPLEHGPQLYLGVDQELTRGDRLSSELTASQSFISGGRRNSLLKLAESWQRQAAANTRVKLSAGASAYRKARPDADASLGLYPVAAAALEHDFLERAQRLELRALAQIGPHQSRLSGDLLQRAELGASARWVLRDDFSIRGRAAAAKELGGTRLSLGALDLAWRLRPEISFSAGTEAVWQQAATDASRSFRWVAFTAVTFTAQNVF